MIVIARDVNVKRVKRRAPEHSEKQRRVAVQQAFPRAKVFLGELDDRFLPVVTLQPDLILFGYDQKLPPGIELKDFAEAGIEVKRAKPLKPRVYKSSLLKKKRVKK